MTQESYTLPSSLRISIEEFQKVLKKHEIETITDSNQHIWIISRSLANYLGFKNHSACFKTIDKQHKCYVRKDTNSGAQLMSCISVAGLICVVLATRKPKSLELAKALNINIKTKYAMLETSFVHAISTVFQNFIIIPQYKVDDYYVDLYFPQFNIVVEFDEEHHTKNRQQDIQRQNRILLKTNCTFVRVMQDDDIFEAIHNINAIILQHLTTESKSSTSDNTQVSQTITITGSECNPSSSTNQTPTTPDKNDTTCLVNSLPAIPQSITDMRKFYKLWITTMKEKYDEHKKQHIKFQWNKVFGADSKVMGKRHHQIKDWLLFLDTNSEKTEELLTMFENFALKHNLNHSIIIKKLFYHALKPHLQFVEPEYKNILPLFKEYFKQAGFDFSKLATTSSEKEI